MKILVTGNHVPFIHGGAEYHQQNLVTELKKRGHEVELMRIPFKFQPESDVIRAMDFCKDYDLSLPNGHKVDRVISLQFPAYGIRHPKHVVWVMHQHRAVYELFDQQPQTDAMQQLKQQITNYDNEVLSKAYRLYANSGRVAERLKHYNDLDATPIYHPPPNVDRFFTAPAMDYIFAPSRLETLKRQSLLIEAARYTESPVKFIIAGTGGQLKSYKQLIDQYQLQDKVRLVGHISEEQKLSYYANSLCVFFAPYDEDYGYITLEAWLSSKPVITANDSGGPTELVEHQKNGWILEPKVEEIAKTIDQAWHDKEKTAQMGLTGRQSFDDKQINWDSVIERLLSDD